jgi:hypothetical protein
MRGTLQSRYVVSRLACNKYILKIKMIPYELLGCASHIDEIYFTNLNKYLMKFVKYTWVPTVPRCWRPPPL